MAKYNLDLVTVQVVTWKNTGSKPADDHISFYGNGNINHHLRQAFSYTKWDQISRSEGKIH